MQRFLAITCVLLAVFVSCTNPGPGKAPKLTADAQTLTLADFETPTDASFSWLPLTSLKVSHPVESRPADSQPATAPESPLARSSLRPHTGLWSESVTVSSGADNPGGILQYAPPDAQAHPLDLTPFDLVSAHVTDLGPAARNDEWSASLLLTDAWGKHIEGDSFPVTSSWDDVPLDLHWAQDQGLDAARIISVSLILRKTPVTSQPNQPEAEAEPLQIQTDTWAAQKRFHAYTGTRPPPDDPKKPPQIPAGKFYVESRGTGIIIGHTGFYEMTLWNRGTSIDAAQRPWIEVWNGTPRRKVLGQPGTGLALFDQTSMDTVTPALRRDEAGRAQNSTAIPPLANWPQNISPAGITASRWQWEVAWASPIATLIEGKQEAGPYDRLGEPALTLKWRLMVYEWGQVFVHVEWEKPRDTAAAGRAPLADPVSWSLTLDRDILEIPSMDDPTQPAGDAERLLTEIYPAAIRQGLETVLPHRMQTGAPVAMIGRSPAAATGGGGLAKNAWWWALTKTDSVGEGGNSDLHRIFGSGIASLGSDRQQHADCMLLVNDPNPLMKAGAFGQYLIPPKVIAKQGEIDRTWPGDFDSDGFVEASGYQVIRLAKGRAVFTIYPQQRPIFYPAFLFTVPAIEREALDLPHARVLINIDGVQFADPPQFPDGSFLLQLPYILDNNPVSVEALLVKKGAHMISVIICSIDRARFDAVCRNYAAVLAGEPFEIIGVHDARSICEGYNRGLAHSKGDIVIFSHDDIEHWAPDLAVRLKRHLEHYDIIGIAGTTRLAGAAWLQTGPPFSCGYVVTPEPNNLLQVSIFGTAGRTTDGTIPNIHALDGVFLTCRRQIAQRLPWDEQTFTGFHCYDMDWTYRAFRENLRLAVALDLPLLHRSEGNYNEAWDHAAEQFMAKHQSTLTPITARTSRYALVAVYSKEDALEIINILNT